jgi:hypothetical protein
MAPINIEIRTIAEYEAVTRLIAKLSDSREEERDTGKLQMLLEAAAVWVARQEDAAKNPSGRRRTVSGKRRGTAS